MDVINVTRTFFPDLEEYVAQLRRVWKNEWLTNRGELVLELESRLKDYLGVENLIVMNNGTLPIQIALKVLGHGGEIITTPFSYVATTSSIIWENCRPVFVDIDAEYLTIDEKKIENSITDKTTAILATHVFGNPCNIDVIEKIANKYQLKVIYDAAHAFGVKYKGESIFNFGDVSTCSFHATKLFHTGEGGAIFCKDGDLFSKLYYSHNFGHNGPLAFHGLGINGKISELQGGLGLVVLSHMEEIICGREKVVQYYKSELDFNYLRGLKLREQTDWNFSYFPVIFESERHLLEVQKQLNAIGVFPRRYFYPSLNTIEYVSGPTMHISEDISSRILCLPLSHYIAEHDLERMVTTINSFLRAI